MVHLLALSQDREEPIRAFYVRLKASASVCELSVPCTATACTERVSYSDKMILHALVRGITDEEIREQVLAKREELGLEETVKFVEAKETGQRSTVQLGQGILASTAVNKITAYKRDQRSDVLIKPKEIPDRGVRCRSCKQTGHNFDSRAEECPAWNHKCNKCQGKGHFAKACPSGRPKVDTQFDVQLTAVHVTPLMDSTGRIPDKGAQCKFCSQTGHGYIPPPKTRRRECPASGETCKNCQKRGHHVGDMSRSSCHQSDRRVLITMLNYLTKLLMRTQMMTTTTSSLFSSKIARSMRWKSL